MEDIDFDSNLTDQEILESGMDCEAIESAVLSMLNAFGENPQREGLKNTPKRVARMYPELLAGYHTDPEKIVNNALFTVTYEDMVIVRDI